jgi:hypothetical protein
MAAVFQPTRALISVEQYYRMGEAGVFPPDQRIELIEGELIEMPPIGQKVEVYSEPGAEGYARRAVLGHGQALRLPGVDGERGALAVDRLFR